MTKRYKSVDEAIGKSIKNHRLASGKTCAQLAMFLDVSTTQISKYETGKDRVSAATLAVIAGYFNVPIELFFAKTHKSNGYNKASNLEIIKLAKVYQSLSAKGRKIVSNFSHDVKSMEANNA